MTETIMKKARETGTVKFWNADRGFGFFKCDRPGYDDVFAHVSALPKNVPSLDISERVSFERASGRNGGREQAVAVELEN